MFSASIPAIAKLDKPVSAFLTHKRADKADAL
jgi:hypothetical protein